MGQPKADAAGLLRVARHDGEFHRTVLAVKDERDCNDEFVHYTALLNKFRDAITSRQRSTSNHFVRVEAEAAAKLARVGAAEQEYVHHANPAWMFGVATMEAPRRRYRSPQQFIVANVGYGAVFNGEFQPAIFAFVQHATPPECFRGSGQ